MATKIDFFQYGVVILFNFVLSLLKSSCTASDNWFHQHPILSQLRR